jgi:dolichyl-phosphate-mannose--protein O-mannosyl transferase
MSVITLLFCLAFVAGGLYLALRFVFPRTAEMPWLSLAGSWLCLAIGLQHGGFVLLLVVLLAVFRGRVAALLTDCGLTRDRVTTIIAARFGKKR